MKKMTMIAGSVCAVALVLGLSSLQVSADSPLKAPEKELTIEGKKPAHFNHATHLKMGLACGTCHHDAGHTPLTADGIAALTDGKTLQCVSCHNDTFSNPALQQPKDIFHARCKECHKLGHKGQKGPTGCTDCHIKQAKKAVEGC